MSNQGEIIEQFVAQEMLAYDDFHKQAKLFYWHREVKNSNAEVDFIIPKQGAIGKINSQRRNEKYASFF